MNALNILLIDDDIIDRKQILRQLNGSASNITVAMTGEDGLDKLRNTHYDVVLLDYRLANITGVEILLAMDKEGLLTVPVIMLSGMDDETLMLKCLEHGAQDYLVKSEVNAKILQRAIRYAKERQGLQQQLLVLAKYDSLTGLANRELFVTELKSVIAKAKRRSEQCAVLFIDLDHFKTINDTLGHATGDELLVSVAARLKASIRDEDMVARLGGDEFAVLLENIKGASNAAKIAEKLLHDLASPHQCAQHVIDISPSIGIATYPDCGIDLDTLMQAADTAMYEAKNCGRNNFQFFSRHLQQLVSDRHSMESCLSDALQANELMVHYQALVDTKSREVIATEALLRWHNPKIGNVLPEQFIPIAEDTGLINAIGAWVLLNACQQNEQWTDDLNIKTPLMIAINVSSIQLKSVTFVDQLSGLLSQISIKPQQLVIEVTEKVLQSEPEVMSAVLNQLHQLGVLIAIDDFGSGYTCLADLAKLPVSWLKIDPLFITAIGQDNTAEGVIKGVITLAHSLGLKVVAEGVETAQQVSFLEQNQCDILQGYYFSRPDNGVEIGRYLSINSTS